MLWWDDGFSNKGKKKEGPQSKVIKEEEPEIVVSCYRSGGSVPVRKLSRKLSTPSQGTPPTVPPPRRKISCPAQPFKKSKPLPKLEKAVEQLLENTLDQELSELTKSSKPRQEKISSSAVPEANMKFAKVSKPKVLSGKTETQQPDVKQELKRGSMKEKWGLCLSYLLDDSRLQIAVNKVSMFSPAAKAGLSAGNIILIINDWQIEAMDKPEVAMSLLLAAGFSVNLAWKKTQVEISDWTKLDNF